MDDVDFFFSTSRALLYLLDFLYSHIVLDGLFSSFLFFLPSRCLTAFSSIRVHRLWSESLNHELYPLSVLPALPFFFLFWSD